MLVQICTMSDLNTFYYKYFLPFAIGSLSGSLPCFVSQPADNVKVVIQLRREDAGRRQAVVSPLAIIKDIYSADGLSGLYRGLDSAILRQIIYCGIRMGLYKLIEERHRSHNNTNMSFHEKVFYALVTGAFASAVANPTDVSVVRFQSDNNMPPNQRRNYRNVFHALATIWREQGWRGYWVGAAPSIARASVVNCAHLVAYNESKERILKTGRQETMGVRLFCSAVAGIAVCALSLPFDNAKTKMMKMKKNPDGSVPYSGLVDCFKKSVQRQGIKSLWVGLPTYYTRVAPHAMLSLMIQDSLHDLLAGENTSV